MDLTIKAPSLLIFNEVVSPIQQCIKLDRISDNFVKGFYHFAKNYFNGSISLQSNQFSKIDFEPKIDNGYERYSILVIHNDLMKIIHFDDIDFLDGFLTLFEWMRRDLIDLEIDILYYDYRRCYRYIDYNLKPDYDPVMTKLEDALNHILIKDIINIILEYYPNICNNYDKNKYQYCDSMCEIDNIICEVCKLHKKMPSKCESAFKVSVRSKFAKD